jgi:hypothetical protein
MEKAFRYQTITGLYIQKTEIFLPERKVACHLSDDGKIIRAFFCNEPQNVFVREDYDASCFRTVPSMEEDKVVIDPISINMTKETKITFTAGDGHIYKNVEVVYKTTFPIEEIEVPLEMAKRMELIARRRNELREAKRKLGSQYDSLFAQHHQ